MPSPALDDDLGISQRREDLAVEQFVSEFCSEIPMPRQIIPIV